MARYIALYVLTGLCLIKANGQSLAGYTFLGNYNGHSYYLSQTGYQWIVADSIARSLGGHLATIADDGENMFIQNAISPTLSQPWIGFNDLTTEGLFEWSDGEQTTYTNWDISEPSNTGGNEDCVVIYYWNGKWNDGDAASNDLFVLEFDNNNCQLIPSVLQSDIISYYPFCGNILDVSGDKNDGVLTDGSLTTDRHGNSNSAVQFNTGDALMCTANIYPGPQTFTIAVWLKTVAQDYRRIVVFDNSQCGHINDWDRSIFINNGQAGFYVFPGSIQNISGGPNIADGSWHHLAATLGSDGMKLYVDGVQVAVNSLITNAQNFSGYWRLGSFQSTSATGSYDDFIIYNRALSAVEVAQLYQSDIPLPVTLENFSASLYNQKVKLIWNMVDENELREFEVEKSIDGSHFIKIAQIHAGQKNYFYFDANSSEKSFYRLKMVYINGSASYSRIVFIRTNVSMFEIYPNPTKTSLNIQFNASSPTTIVKIQDEMGRLLKTINLLTNNGINATTIDISYLQRGFYFISLNGEVKKIIKE